MIVVIAVNSNIKTEVIALHNALPEQFPQPIKRHKNETVAAAT